MNQNWKPTGEFIPLINGWFDIFDAKSKYGYHPGCNGFGVDLIEQLHVINRTTEVITMSVGKHKGLLPFQKRIILKNCPLIDLFRVCTFKTAKLIGGII